MGGVHKRVCERMWLGEGPSRSKEVSDLSARVDAFCFGGVNGATGGSSWGVNGSVLRYVDL